MGCPTPEAAVDPTPLLDRILDDEGLTGGLDEAEATLLIRTLADRVRKVASGTSDPATAARQTEILCRNARHVAARVTAVPRAEAAALLSRLLAEWPTRAD
jgi:hypothetical protein